MNINWAIKSNHNRLRMHKAIYVIGISGISNGGKTTLTHRLQKAFPGSYAVCQDTYFREEGSDKLVIDPELNHANWESLTALDMDQMLSDLTTYLKDKRNSLSENPATAPHFVFVDGFTIFNYYPLSSIWSKKYFITLNKEEAKRRRSGRNYVPADVPGYFDKFVWPMYEKHRKEMEDQREIVYLDGAQNQEILYNKVVGDLNSLVADGVHPSQQ